MAEAEATAAKERGNELYKANKIDEALAEYTKGLKAAPAGGALAATLHKNLAACYLKQDKAKEVIEHCNAALKHDAGDVKALFRRAQAYEKDDQLDKAFADFVKASQIDPKNKQAKQAATRLMEKVSSKISQQQSTEGRSDDMLSRALGDASESERVAAARNLVVIAQEEPGAEKLYRKDFVNRVVPLLSSPIEEVQIAILRAYGCVATNKPERAVAVLNKFASSELTGKLMSFIQQPSEKIVSAAMNLLSCLTETLSSESATSESDKQALDKVVEYLVALIPHGSISAHARDLALTIVMRFAKNSDFGKRFMDKGGVRALVITASFSCSPLVGDPTKASVAMSSETRMHVSIALSKVYEATFEKHKPSPKFTEECKSAISFDADALDHKINIPPCYALTALLQAVVEVGNQILEEENILTILMEMAKKGDRETQCAAAEAITHAASDTKRIRGIMTEAFQCLKALYAKDLPDAIRVRALVGLCKMGSMHGGAVNMRTLAEGATVNLAKKLRPFLVGENTNLDTQRWAAEGMAYLTLDAEVKEYVTADPLILKAIHKVCMQGEKTVRYSMANMLANITNSYDKPEETEETKQLKRLGKIAKENIPEPHPKDATEFALVRIQKLIDSNFVEPLVELAKSDSMNTREQVARVLLAFVNDQKNRGRVIQQGGAKALLPLARENTDKGLMRAAQALAKLAITHDPSRAFPGQRTSELVKPLLKLMRERNGLLQFEAAMAMCNLASVSEDLRSRIVKEHGVKHLEDLMFDEDPLVRRAGTEAMVNMFSSDKVFEMFATPEGPCWERVKLWILLAGSGEEDYPTARAAAGGLALLSRSKHVCQRIKEEKQGLTILRELLTSGEDELYHRVLFIISNMVTCSKELAEAVCANDGAGFICVILHTTKNPAVKELATEVVERLIEHKLLKSMEDTQRVAVECAIKFQAEMERQEKERQARKAEREAAAAEEEEEEEEGRPPSEEPPADSDDEEIAAAAAAGEDVEHIFADDQPAIMELDDTEAGSADA